ncbi:MAG: Cadherin-like beta sandwich protein [Fibrobacteria bacterium]|jgi:photosystem II stability/assembly factor-like uncharacterized protein|nr:Cadherin-like beta sandwich protein [Fibrobacteria bacterium]
MNLRLGILVAASALSLPRALTIPNSSYTAYDEVVFVNTDVGYAAGTSWVLGIPNGPMFYKTTDGGKTWNPRGSTSGIEPRFLAFSDTSRGWARGARTTDGGATWLPAASFSAIHFLDAKHGWGLRDLDSEVVHTTNGGDTWTVRSRWTPKGSVSRIAFADTSRGWMISGAGAVLRTTNGGAVWASHPTGAPDTLYSLQFASPAVGWVAGDGGTILKTLDSGKTWARQHTGTTGRINCVRFSSPDSGWATGERVLLQTTNGGSAWIPHPPERNGSFIFGSSLFLFSGGEGWIAGGNGLLAKITNGAVAGLVAPKSTRHFRAFANKHGMVRYDLPVRSRVKASLYHPHGKLARVLIDGLQEPGEYVLNASSAASGVYILDFQDYRGRSVGTIFLP